METMQTRLIKFSVLVALQPQSIICYVGLIHHILSNRASRQALHNHGPLVLLLVGFITVTVDLPMVLNFLRTGVVSPSIDLVCRIWTFFDMLLYSLVCILMLWVSIERHILIFHYRNWLNTKQKRFFVHYVPLVVIFVYLISFYVYGAFIYPCKNNFDYRQVCCYGLCFATENLALGVYDQLAHTVIPSFLIVIVNAALWWRIFWRKVYRMRQGMEWRRRRKIIIQFAPVAILYMSGYLTYGFLQCYQLIHGPTSLTITIQQLYFFYLFYLVGLLHPFVCLIGMREVYRKWLPVRNRRVTPVFVQEKIQIYKIVDIHI